MFCNNCGSQVPDGMNFCATCGNQLSHSDSVQNFSAGYDYPPATPPAYSQPAVQPEPPKNNNGLIIAVVAAILVVALVVTGVFLFVKDKDENGEGEEKNSTSASEIEEEKTKKTEKSERTEESTEPSTEPPTEAEEPLPSLVEAANISIDYSLELLWFELERVAEYEPMGADGFYDIVDDSLINMSGASLSEVYDALSTEFGVTINNAETLIAYVLSTADMEAGYAGKYGSDFSFETDNVVYDFITEEEAMLYIEDSKDVIEGLTDVYADTDEIFDRDFEYYAMVSFDVIASGSLLTETSEETFVLGYIDGEWKVLYAEEDGEAYGLLSLYGLEEVL